MLYTVSMKGQKLDSVRLYGDEKQRVQDLAKKHGFVIGRGANAQAGSVRGLLLAIIDGDITLVKVVPAQQ